MDWLRRLLEPRTRVPRYGQEAAPAPIDWPVTEDRLVRLVVATLATHFAGHPGETAIALCLDCNAERGEVLVCVLPASAPAGSHPWDVGTWPCHGINLRDPTWRREWSKVPPAMEQSVMWLLNGGRGADLPALREQFLCMAARAVLRIAAAPELAEHVVDDVRVNAIDHDESPESGLARLARLRAEAGVR
jgi:hypothetical protein